MRLSFSCKRRRKRPWPRKQTIRTRILVRRRRLLRPPLRPPLLPPLRLPVHPAALIHLLREAIPAGAHTLRCLGVSDPQGAEESIRVQLALEVTVQDLILGVADVVRAANERSVARDLFRHRRRS